MTLIEQPTPGIDAALDVLTDRSLTVEDRAAAYGVIHQVQLRLNRALKKVKDELVVYLVENGMKELGPISLKSVAFEVEWPCNAEGNWTELGVQDQMRTIHTLASEYFRHIPDHYEIDTAALGQGVAKGDPVARQMHRDLKEMGWRTEAGRRVTLQVREVKQ